MIDRHPWITQMPMAAPPLAPNSLTFVERGLETLDGTGLADPDKLRVIGLLSSCTLSEARMAHGRSPRQRASAGSGRGNQARSRMELRGAPARARRRANRPAAPLDRLVRRHRRRPIRLREAGRVPVRHRPDPRRHPNPDRPQPEGPVTSTTVSGIPETAIPGTRREDDRLKSRATVRITCKRPAGWRDRITVLDGQRQSVAELGPRAYRRLFALLSDLVPLRMSSHFVTALGFCGRCGWPVTGHTESGGALGRQVPGHHGRMELDGAYHQASRTRRSKLRRSVALARSSLGGRAGRRLPPGAPTRGGRRRRPRWR